MELTNFRIASDVELEGLGQWWDLHNCADFVRLELLLEPCGARLCWEVLPLPLGKSPPWGFSGGNPARSCAIRFDKVGDIAIRYPSDSWLPNEGTIEWMGLVAPIASTPKDVVEHGYRVPSTEDDATMLFRFMDGFEIEVAARSATLIGDE